MYSVFIHFCKFSKILVQFLKILGGGSDEAAEDDDEDDDDDEDEQENEEQTEDDTEADTIDNDKKDEL